MTRASRVVAGLGIALLFFAPCDAPAQTAGVITFARTIAIASYGTLPFALSPDGRFFATSTNGTTHVFATEDRHEVAALPHPKDMYALAFSPDGATLVSSGDGATAWSTKDWKERWSVAPGTHFGPVAFMPDSHTFYSTGNSQLLARDADTGVASESVALGSTPVSAVAVSKDGAIVAAGSSGGGLRLIATVAHTITPIADTTRYSEKATAAERAGSLAHPGHISALAFSTDNALLASAGGDGTIKLWRLQPWNPPLEKPLWRIVCGGNIEALVFERGDSVLDAGCGRAILRIDTRTGSILTRLRSHGEDVATLAAESDAVHLWSASLDGTLKRWDLTSGFNVATYGALSIAALSADGQTLAFNRGDDAILLVNPTNDHPIATLRGHELPLTLGSYSYSRAVLAVSNDGVYVAAGGYITAGFIDHTGVAGGVTRVWKHTARQPLRTWTGVAPETLTFAADGTQLVARSPQMSDTPDTVWTAGVSSTAASAWKPTVKSLESFCRVEGFGNSRVAFGARPSLLIAFGECDGHQNLPARLRYWPIGATVPDAPFAGTPIPNALIALSSDGRAISVGTRVTVWDTRTRRPVADAPLTAPNKNETLLDVALGGNVAVGLYQTDLWRNEDRYRYALVVWDARSGRQLARTQAKPVGERPQLLVPADGSRAYVTTPAGIDVWALKSSAGLPI